LRTAEPLVAALFVMLAGQIELRRIGEAEIEQLLVPEIFGALVDGGSDIRRNLIHATDSGRLRVDIAAFGLANLKCLWAFVVHKRRGAKFLRAGEIGRRRDRTEV